MIQQSKQQKVIEAIGQLELGSDKLDIKDFVIKNWGRYDLFIRRSFDVFFSKAKKEFPNRVFKVQMGAIKRVK